MPTLTDPDAATVDAPGTKDKLNALALSLAYEYATDVIERNSADVSADSGQAGDWFEIDPKSDDRIMDCVQYLEARELLIRHPDHANWVSMFDESEATA